MTSPSRVTIEIRGLQLKFGCGRNWHYQANAYGVPFARFADVLVMRTATPVVQTRLLCNRRGAPFVHIHRPEQSPRIPHTQNSSGNFLEAAVWPGQSQPVTLLMRSA
jgi:hypothetical protein